MTSYTVVFDGGSRGNPGRGYGSYRLSRDGKPGDIREGVEFDMGDVTNNEAEYLTLIQALHRLHHFTRSANRSARTVTVIGDSKLVLNQVSGQWGCNEPRLQWLCDAAKRLLSDFGGFTTQWVKRDEMVKEFGH